MSRFVLLFYLLWSAFFVLGIGLLAFGGRFRPEAFLGLLAPALLWIFLWRSYREEAIRLARVLRGVLGADDKGRGLIDA